MIASHYLLKFNLLKCTYILAQSFFILNLRMGWVLVNKPLLFVEEQSKFEKIAVSFSKDLLTKNISLWLWKYTLMRFVIAPNVCNTQNSIQQFLSSSLLNHIFHRLTSSYDTFTLHSLLKFCLTFLSDENWYRKLWKL